MPKTQYIELGDHTHIPILYEDRSVMALDKPPGWILAPDAWENTRRNLQRAIDSCIMARFYWVRSRNLNYLRYVHRLDADTSGILLFARSPGALDTIGGLFEQREVEKRYLAVVYGTPRNSTWVCDAPLGPVPGRPGYMQVDPVEGKEAETHFRVLGTGRDTALIEARPTTGRTHQIRLHLLESGHPVIGDVLYGHEIGSASRGRSRLGLRAVKLAYRDPFQRREVRIHAPTEAFLNEFGFLRDEGADAEQVAPKVAPEKARPPRQPNPRRN
ncbi:MAG: RluA family pseudouridine synthase [Verrucomicrobia bacterium]|nr:RluA family pseudouridine synthase [Verrucomicrobiota bacterium]